ncbi:hypothetical protein [Salmonirosea aquatica]|uniref:GNAT family N-acetyltransferase n=1 Tax=Salmonirosea aquatica TaxID=2654236 RepID=A0A7C9BC55_9BACT|nr:hypothetical protein [Cytophagaceae bacterium SJW1-29]
MKRILRKSVPTDAAAFVALKSKLPMPTGNDQTSAGGFLLGTDLATYEWYIQNTYSLSLEYEGNLVGFGILIPDAIVKQGELWAKRNAAEWQVDVGSIENKAVCYFEQLAFLKGYGRFAPELCYHLIDRAFGQGHELLLTTTVNRPVVNQAAIPFIRAVGGQLVGNIDEYYPEVGPIHSDIWAIESEEYFRKVQGLSFYPRLKANTIKW